MLDLSTPKQEDWKTLVHYRSTRHSITPKSSISERISSKNPTGSLSTNPQTETGLLLSQQGKGRAGISPGTKQTLAHLPPCHSRSHVESVTRSGAKNCSRCLPAIWLRETLGCKRMGERRLCPQHGTEGECKAWERTALEINPTGMPSSNAKGTSRR